MICKPLFPMLALPLVLSVAACGNPEAQQEGQAQEATIDQPGFEDTSATPSQVRSEALTLAGHLAAGDLDRSDAAVVLEDLDTLVTDNIVEFPEDIRPALTQDIQSARDALEGDDMAALQEAASQMQAKLSGTVDSSQPG